MINIFPKITVVTVCFNSVNNIEKTILSVVNQTYSNVEYIIIDGGSNDGTVEIIKKYSSKISTWISEPDGGVYFGMNKGIAMAKGEWINFMNAGDLFASSDVLKKCFEDRAYNDDVAMLCGDTICAFPWAYYLKLGKNKSGKINFCHQSVFTRTSLLKKNPYDTSYRIIADNVWYKQLMELGAIFEYVPIQISIYEGYNGISAKNAVNFYKEVSRENESVQNIHWKLSLLKLKVKLFFQSFVSKKKRDKKWERKLDKTLIRLDSK